MIQFDKDQLSHILRAMGRYRTNKPTKSIICHKALHACVHVCQVASIVSDSLQPEGPPRLLCPWDSLGKNPAVGCHVFLQAHKDYWADFFETFFPYM